MKASAFWRFLLFCPDIDKLFKSVSSRKFFSWELWEFQLAPVLNICPRTNSSRLTFEGTDMKKSLTFIWDGVFVAEMKRDKKYNLKHVNLWLDAENKKSTVTMVKTWNSMSRGVTWSSADTQQDMARPWAGWHKLSLLLKHQQELN